MSTPYRTPGVFEPEPKGPLLARVRLFFMTPKLGRPPWFFPPWSGGLYGVGCAQLLLSIAADNAAIRLGVGLALVAIAFTTAYILHKRNHRNTQG